MVSDVSETILQRRLDAGLAIAGGARGSLTKALQQQPNTSTPTRQQNAALLHLEMTKLALIIQRNERLLAEKDTDGTVHPQEDSPMISLQDMRKELEHAKAQHECWQTYEGLAAAIVQKHVFSEAQLNADIAKIDLQYTRAKEQLVGLRTTVQARASQCHLLQQCVQDLQQSVEEDRVVKDEDKKQSKARAGEIEDTVMKDASEDEEGELYGDLDNNL